METPASCSELQYTRLSDLMVSSITQIWAKWGILESLRAIKSLSPHIPKQIVLEKWQYLSDKQKARLWDQRVIIRQSNPLDFDGLVDVLETVICKPDEVHSVLQRIETWTNVSDIIWYARREWLSYNPEETKILISPYIYGTRVTITEHPNIPGVILVDGSTKHLYPDPRNCPPDTSYDTGPLRAYTTAPEYYKASEKLVKKIRETGLFPDDITIQFEGVYESNWNTRTWGLSLTQVRFFAKRKKRETQEWWENAKLFWVPGEKIKNGISMKLGIAHSIAEIGSTKYNTPLLAVRHNSEMSHMAYPWDDVRYMVAGGMNYNRALGHNNTRPIQALLKRSGIVDIWLRTAARVRDIHTEGEVMLKYDIWGDMLTIK